MSIDIFLAYAKFGHEQRISLHDPKSVDGFTAHVKGTLEQALTRRTLLHGQRTQNLFEALIVSLGNYKLLKTEDAGRVHPEEKYKVPDFRAVLNDGSHLLIEVKNCFCQTPFCQRFTMKVSYLDKLQAYASVMDCPLKLALYWARWGIWTLIDPNDFKIIKEGILGIEMTAALRVNEMASLGDRTIGTTPPLRMVFLSDPAKSCTLSTQGELAMTIGEVKMFCGVNEVTSQTERNVLGIFMEFGDWDMRGPEAVTLSDQVVGVQFIWSQRQTANPDERFEMIGTLSSMFSRYYAVKTLGQEGVVQIEADFTPGWFAPLASDVIGTTPSIPLWRFILQPNRS